MGDGYLRGPLTREQIASLTSHEVEALPPPPPGVAAASLPPPTAAVAASPAADASPVAPKVADNIPVRYLDPAAPWAPQIGAVPGGAHLVAAAVARVSMVFDDDKAGLREVQEWESVWCPLPSPPDPTAAVAVDYDERNLVTTAPPGAQYALCDAPIGTKAYWTSLQRNLVDQLVRTRTMQISRNAKLKLYSRASGRHPSSSRPDARRPRTRSPIRSSHPSETSTPRATRGHAPRWPRPRTRSRCKRRRPRQRGTTA